MSINPRFIEYFHDTFFREKPEEFKLFLTSLEQWIPRTIRIKPGKEKEVQERLASYGFVLENTYIPNVFTLGRSDDFHPLERRIGFTLDHLIGNFYIQELAAATSVHILTDGKIHDEEFVILDMAASPGGKTTQLRERYPNAFIIANEPTRERIPQLLQNLDRMGSENIGVTLYPGQYFRTTPEIFDRILLDAPCSGEGTLYKGTDATKHWHIKNIKTIARLQEKLIDAAIIALKVWWEMVYSTCSMNLLENEWVLESIKLKHPNSFEITYEKHFWPHIDHTGWFFVAKIRKTAPIETEEKSRIINTNEEIKTYKWHLHNTSYKDSIILYEHTGKILAVKKHRELENLRKQFYFMRFWEKIASIEDWVIRFDPFAHRYIDTTARKNYSINNEEELDKYLRGETLESMLPDGWVLVTYQDSSITLEEVSEWRISNNFPHDWRRK
jgi:16S rRNA (cytosine1407-C5)-methyltransferase